MTGLCFCMLPDHTLASKTDGQKVEDCTVMKERMILLFFVNKTGSHKLKPLCIGKSQSPMCFHHNKMETSAFIYQTSKSTSMMAEIFEECFHKLYIPSLHAYLRNKSGTTSTVIIKQMSFTSFC